MPSPPSAGGARITKRQTVKTPMLGNAKGKEYYTINKNTGKMVKTD